MTGSPVLNSCQAQFDRSQAGGLPAAGMTLFCDFDGPIIDVSDRYYSTYQLGLVDTQALYQSQGTTLPIQVLTKEQFWQMKQERIPDIEIAMRSGLQPEQIEVFLQRVTHIVNQPTLLHKDHLQAGVRWALALLHSRGVRLVLVTLRCRQQVRQILESYELLHLFTAIWGTDDIESAYNNYADQKTALLAQALAAQKTQANQSQSVWMIGDTEADILAGQAAAVPTIALTCGIRSQRYLERFSPDRIHSDLLSATHYLLNYQQLQPFSCV